MIIFITSHEWKSSPVSGSKAVAARRETRLHQAIGDLLQSHLRARREAGEAVWGARCCSSGAASWRYEEQEGENQPSCSTARWITQCTLKARPPGDRSLQGWRCCLASKLGKPGHSPMWDSHMPMIQESPREDAVVSTWQVGAWCLGDLSE